MTRATSMSRGNHPQLSDALQSVRALHEAYAAHQRERSAARASERGRDARETSSRGRDGGDGGTREKKRRRERERRSRERKRSRKGRRRESSSDSSSSGSDSRSERGRRGGGRKTRDARGLDAAEALRQALAKFPTERAGLRELLRTVDLGKGAATAGIADETVRRYLDYFFENAGLRRSKRTGAWTLRDDDDGLISRFAFVFDESPDSLKHLANAREPWLGPDPAVVAAEKAQKEAARAAKRANAAPQREVQILTGDEAHAFMAEHDSDSEHGERKPASVVVPAPGPVGIGPTARPPVAPVAAAEEESAPSKRVLGPMAPPKSMLEAAAAELEFDSTLGPPPPEIMAELEGTSDETREACAVRIMRIVRRGGDAYDILGVKTDENAGAIKKKYWKLSLMVHPDKCAHEDAKDAFDAIKKAHTSLADESQRAVIDEKRNAANEREEFEKWLADEREKAAWRRLKGTPLPGDDELLDGAKEEGDKREEWMTHLPPEKRPNQGPPTANVTSFSKSEKVARTAEMEAAWTDNPQQAAAREKQLFLQAQEQQYALPAAKAKEEQAKRLVEDYNAAYRTKSLVEIHQERQRGEHPKKEKKEKRHKQEKMDTDKSLDGTNWEYRPFDRDTDLKLRKPGDLKPEELLKRAGGGLGDRFTN